MIHLFPMLALFAFAWGQNAFPPGNFDQTREIPSAWFVRDRDNTRLENEKGNRFVRFHSDDGSKVVNLGTSLDLKPEWKKINLTIRIHARGVVPGKEAWHAATVMLRLEDGARKLVPPYPNKPVVKGTQDWTLWKEAILIPERATVLRIEPGLFFATGDMDLDDIVVEPQDAGGATVGAKTEPAGAPYLGPSFPPEAQQKLNELLARVKGGTVDESQVKVTLWVDAGATPGGDGTTLKPFQTLSAGLALAQSHLKDGLGVRLRLRPGIYREGGFQIRGSQIGGQAQETPLLIEGTEPEGVVISGSDIYEAGGWKAAPGQRGVWAREWDQDQGLFGTAFGNMSPRRPIGHRRDMLFIDGEFVPPVMLEDWEVTLPPGTTGRPTYDFRRTLGPETLTPFSYGVTEKESPKRVYFKPRGPWTPAGHTFEIAVRTHAFDIREKDNLVLRNLTFRHFASLLSIQSEATEAAVALTSPMKQVVVDHCRFEWNNAIGLRVYSAENLTVKDCDFCFNGTCGLSGNKLVNTKFLSNKVAFNAWRAFMGGTVGWWVAGAKFAGTVDSIWRGNTVAGNTGRGLWYDIGNQGVLVDDHLSWGNIRGVFFEISEGPVFVRRSLLVGSRNSCLQAESTKNVFVAETIVYGTHSSGVKIPMYKRASKNLSVDRPGAVSVMNSILVSGNPETTALSESVWPKTGSREGDAEALSSYYTGSRNTWFGPDARVIKVVSAQVTGGMKDLETWSSLRKETGSRFQNPGFADPLSLDFRFRPDSPFAAVKDRFLAIQIPATLVKTGSDFHELTIRLDPPGFTFDRDDYQEEKNNF